MNLGKSFGYGLGCMPLVSALASSLIFASAEAYADGAKLKIVPATQVSNGRTNSAVKISLEGTLVQGSNYVIRYAPRVTGPWNNWQTINVNNTNSTYSVTELVQGNGKFYKLK